MTRGRFSHPVASLQDGVWKCARAAAESLGQIGDPSAIAPLNDPLLRETSRQLPQAVIRHVINSITVADVKRPVVESPAPVMTAPPAAEPPNQRVVEKASEPQVEKAKTPRAGAPSARSFYRVSELV